MSAIATFTKLPKIAIDGLREAAVPKKRLFRATRDGYHDYLRQHGRQVVEYKYSGFVLATLLPYLEERHQINLMKSNYDELSSFLTKSRRATHFIFTDAHRQSYLSALDGQFTEQVLRDYFNEFNESDEADVGKAMLDGIKVFRQSLAEVDKDSVIVFSIA